MAECLECKKYTKYKNGVCKSCFIKRKAREKETKNEENTKFPSHTDLYRDLHIIEDDFLLFLVAWLKQEKKIDLTSDIDNLSYDIEIEENFWDIIVNLSIKKFTSFAKEEDNYENYKLFIEYKSSINEWGKQIDQFFRQIKARINTQKINGLTIKQINDLMNFDAFVLLVSFDDAFLDYEDACKKAGINLVVLSEKFLYILQGRNKEEKLDRLKNYEKRMLEEKEKQEERMLNKEEKLKKIGGEWAKILTDNEYMCVKCGKRIHYEKGHHNRTQCSSCYEPL